MIQKEYFKTLTTDHLLNHRFSIYCSVPFCDKSRLYEYGYILHKPTLLEELATRPHRVRAKDRRTKKL